MLHKNALVKEINCKPSISVIISCRRQNIQQQILQNLYVYSPRHIITFVSFLDMTFIDFNFNLEIRVGEDGNELGNNKICLGDIEFIGSKAANLTCLQAVFGDWVSINKSAPSNSYHSLVFDEVHVFDGKYIRADGSQGARLTKTYDVTIQRYRNSHAKIQNSKMHILRCMGSNFCVKFERCPLKFHTKFWTHTPQNMHFTRW